MRKRDSTFFDLCYIISFTAMLSICNSIVPILLAVSMQKSGIAGWIIGLSAATQFLPRLINHARIISSFNPNHIIYFCLMMGVIAISIFALTDSVSLWLLARLAYGITISGSFITCETWIQKLAANKSRGRAFASYSAARSFGLLIGPAVLQITMLEIILSSAAALISLIIAIIPVAMITKTNIAPVSTLKVNASKNTWLIVVKRKPLTVILAMAAGTLLSTIATLLPVWGMKNGILRVQIVNFGLMISLGSVILQIPIGIITDRFGPYVTVVSCAILGAISAFSIMFLVGSAYIYMPLFTLGSIFFTFASLGMSIQGNSFGEEDKVHATSVCSLFYGIGALSITPLIGFISDAFSLRGIFMCLITLCVIIAAAVVVDSYGRAKGLFL